MTTDYSELKARLEKAKASDYVDGWMLVDDVLALIAEVERLRRIEEAARAVFQHTGNTADAPWQELDEALGWPALSVEMPR